MAIKERDGYMCQWCLKNEGHINLTKLEVHHIVPLIEDRELALEPSNLITLCRYHHEQAEKGKISRKDIRALVKAEGSADSPQSCKVLYFLYAYPRLPPSKNKKSPYQF